MKADTFTPTVETPNGTDGKKYRNFNPKDICRHQKILTNLYFTKIVQLHPMSVS
jgi:hypothetical protein